MLKKVSLFLLCIFSAAQLHAQIALYYGKNQVKYDTFHWRTYKTEHFEIFFYPSEEEHLQRVASMAESAYDKVSTDLQHEIEFKIPLIYFLTSSEFEQVNYLQISEGILGVAEPQFNRMAFALDVPSDFLQEVITHELTHVFEFSLLFGGILTPILKTSPPSWVMEGFSEYETGIWTPSDAMVVRDAVLTERLPFLSIEGDLIYPGGVDIGRGPYNIGHAAFDFIRDKYGESAVRQFWFYLKKATLLGGEDVIYSSLGIKEEAFNEQFSEYLRKRFEVYRDKQSPIDYGKEIQLPKKFRGIFSQTPSPDGKEFAVITANYRDYEFDILKIDRNGTVIKDLTGGITTRYDYLTTDSFTYEGRNISWSADGKKIAFFARTGKRRSLFIVDANSGHRIKRLKLKIDQAGSPAFSPDGNSVLFTGDLNGQPDIFLINAHTGQLKNMTEDLLYEKTPIWSPDGRYIYYSTRIHTRDQIMRMDASNPKQIEQLTFSDYNSTSPIYDPKTNSVYYAADRDNVSNIYRLNMDNGEKIQYTDVIGGNFSPNIIHDSSKDTVAFTTYFKGQYRFFIMDLPPVVATIAKGSEPEGGEPLQKSIETAALNPDGTPLKGMAGLPALATTDFEPSKEISINKSDIQKKKFRGLLTGRPEVLTGVSGDTFAIATGVSVQDILGDQQVDFYISRIRGFQSYDVGYLDLGHRIQYRADFQFNDDFLIAPVPIAVAVQTGFTSDVVRQRVYGGQIISQYPLNRYYRFEMGTALLRLTEEYEDPTVQQLYKDFLNATGQPDFLSSGNYLPLNLSFVGETTRFREFGPISGHTLRLSLQYAVPFSNSWISRTILDGDFRKYFRMTTTSLFAVRLRGFYSSGNDPVIFSFGGGGDVRGLDFREAAGNRGGIANLEYRFPVFPNPRIPVLGQMRARVFNDFIKAKFVSPTGNNISYTTLNFIYRDVDKQLFAYDLNKGVAAVGAGFTAFLGGTPFNFDFSKLYGPGRFALPSGLPDFFTPQSTRFQDGIHFDFSIIYDF